MITAEEARESLREKKEIEDYKKLAGETAKVLFNGVEGLIECAVSNCCGGIKFSAIMPLGNYTFLGTVCSRLKIELGKYGYATDFTIRSYEDTTEATISVVFDENERICECTAMILER